MRTALVLLLLLALAAIPGSLIPQRDIDAFAVVTWKADHPKLAGPFETLGMFSVYTSVWFSAVYLLLVVSLVGCLTPRLRNYVRALRRPPAPPSRRVLSPAQRVHLRDTGDGLDVAERWLRRRRYRIRVSEGAIAAERGYLREAGNLVFHGSILVVLVAYAVGKMFGYTAAVSVVDGDSVANTVGQYDNLVPGSLFTPDQLDPFSLTVEDFDAEFIDEGPQLGQPESFAARLSADLVEGSSTTQVSKTVEVNDPLSVGDTSVFLVGHGYAPRITVRDAEGDVVVSGPTIFLPEDATFTSYGVVKAADAAPRDLALEGQLYPTYAFTMETGPMSVFPQPDNPVLSMLVTQGDLGLDSGVPQSVFSLPETGLEPLRDETGEPFRLDIALGQTVDLPRGAGSVTFEGVDRFVRLQISQSPGEQVALLAIALGLAGLLVSLYVRPRRIVVRSPEDEEGSLDLMGADTHRHGHVARDIGRLADHLIDFDRRKGPRP